MLRIACESCKAPYQVDERRVPPQGLKMRCPKCGTTFLVTLSGTAPLPNAAPPKTPQMTMVEGNEDAVRKAIATAEAKSGVKPPAPSHDGADDLPAARTPIKAPPPKPAAPAAKPAPPKFGATKLGLSDPVAPVAPVARPALPDPGPAPDPDLPAARPAPPRAAPRPGPPAPVAKPPAAPVAKPPVAAPVAKPPAAAPPAPKVAPPSNVPDIDLPAARVAPPKPAPAAAPKESIEGGEWDLPAMPDPGGAGDPASHFPAALGKLDDLPAARGGPPPKAPAPAPAAPPKNAPAFGDIDLGLDLPATASVGLPAPGGAALPARAQAAQANLPAPVQANLPAPVQANLPAPAQGNLPAPAANLPARKLSGGFEIDLGNIDPASGPSFELDVTPPKKPPPPKPIDDSAFGELDLPTLGSALPAVADVLPTAANALPAPQQSLPAAQQSFPAPQQSLPAAMHGDELDLGLQSIPPSVQPPPAGRPSAEISMSGFGELDLDGPLASSPPAAPAPEPAGGFGEIDLSSGSASSASSHIGEEADDLLGGVISAPPPAEAPPPEPPPAAKGEGNALAFGELDLGGGDGGRGGEEAGIPTMEAPAVRLPPAEASLPGTKDRTSGSPAAVELSLPTAMPGSRPRHTEEKAPSKAPRVFLVVLALLVAGGGALQLTKHGAFGYLTIGDKLRADEYAKATSTSAAAARDRMGKDTVVDGRGAVDDIFAARARTPRAKSLSAYAAFTTFAYEQRFGADPQRDSRAKAFLSDVKDEPDVKYLAAALAAQDAAAGNFDKAAKGLDGVAKRDVGDPIQRDIAELRGFVAIALRDYAGAKTAFDTAIKLAPTARAHYGLALAYVGLKQNDSAKTEIAATLAATPNHSGALFLRAAIEIAARDEKGALADLATIIEGPGKALASTEEYANALALRGGIQASRGRGGEARASFEAAIQSDPNNVNALYGLGHVYFDDGRYTEALTRLDTALSKAPSDERVIALDALTKVKLERLKEAKDQITAARVVAPKSMRLAYTLGIVEMALGNRAGAEKALAESIDLVQPSDGTDGVMAYVAFASFLAAADRAKEADAKLDDMKLKLPDSVEMQRALGGYDAEQGRFDSAVVHFRNAIELDPQDLSTRFQLAITLRRMRRMDESAIEFDKVLAADKDYPGLARERGLLYEQSGEVEKALEQFKNALAKAPDDADLTLRVGAAYVAIGRPDDALPMLKKVLDKRPQSAEANHYLGRALLSKGGASMQDAARYLKHAVELDPNRAEYHLYLAWAANEANPVQLGLAETEIEKALAIDKLLADAYWQRAVTERKKGLVEDALKDLKRALELKPNRVEAHATMAECYEDKNDEGNAVAEWQKAIAANDRVPYWRYRYGKLLFQHGNSAEAAKHLTYAATEAAKLEGRTPWLGDAEFYAAEALRRSGRRDEAIAFYEKFLAIAPTSSPDRRDAITALSQLGKPYGGGDRR